MKKLDEYADKQQNVYMRTLKPKLLKWSLEQNAKIEQIYCITAWGESLGAYIFYKTDAELKKFTENGLVEKTKEEFFRILKEIGYIEEFNDIVRFEFDSDENVKKNYEGSYYFRLL